MKIYLAGKIGKNDWRHEIVSGLRGAIHEPPCHTNDERLKSWPILKNAIAGQHDYTGPYFISCDHGCFHGENTHGYFDNYQEEDYAGGLTEFWRYLYFQKSTCRLCLQAIAEADMVFAWIDSPDCHGTLFEIGLAKGKKKPVHVAGPKPFTDLWFMYAACHASSESFKHETAVDALDYILHKRYSEKSSPQFESPIEEKFWQEWQRQGGDSYIALEYQYSVLGGKYRLDFAMPSKKYAIELDGYEWHSDRERFTKDRQRQREIEAEGWRFIRFSGREINANVTQCFQEAVQTIKDSND